MPSPPPGLHTLKLPQTRGVGANAWASVDAAPGQAPSGAHRLGTVLVGQTTPDEPSPTVTEWDLATGDFVRSTALPLPAAYSELAMVRTERAVHLVLTEGPRGPIAYARLGADLSFEKVAPLGEGEPPRIATDGAVVAVLWSGVRVDHPREAGLQLTAIDPEGEAASACLDHTTTSASLLGDPLGVARGQVFVLLPDGAAVRLLHTDAGVRSAAVRALPWMPNDARLFAALGRLYFTDDRGSVELWPGDRMTDGLVPLPDRTPQARGRALAFRVASSEHGDLLTAQGDVLWATGPMGVSRRVVPLPGHATVLRPLWLFGAPSLLALSAAGEPTLRVSVPSERRQPTLFTARATGTTGASRQSEVPCGDRVEGGC